MDIYSGLFGNGSKIDTSELYPPVPERYVYPVANKQSKTIKFNGAFACLLLTQGGGAGSSTAYLLQGYGTGGVRYNVITLNQGNGSISCIVGADGAQTFILTNNHAFSALDIHLVMFFGAEPIVT